jgi:hypothetical protein
MHSLAADRFGPPPLYVDLIFLRFRTTPWIISI